jgi:hypothetical protein
MMLLLYMAGLSLLTGAEFIERFLGGKRQELSLLHQVGDHHIRVDHGFRDVRRAAASFGGRAELLSHVRDRLFSGLHGHATSLPGVHRCRSADRAAAGHVDAVCSQTDQRSGGNRPLVDERHGVRRTSQQCVANLHGGVHAATQGVDLQHDSGRARCLSLVEYASHVRRETQIDGTLIEAT